MSLVISTHSYLPCFLMLFQSPMELNVFSNTIGMISQNGKTDLFQSPMELNVFSNATEERAATTFVEFQSPMELNVFSNKFLSILDFM